MLDEERNPVAGVQVSVLLPRVVATTDETGAYALALQNAPAYVQVTVAADGYGSSVYQVPLTGPGETRRDFRASRLTVVRPGESVDMRLYPDDPTCGFDLEFFCRSVSVHSPTSGLVEVTLTQGEGFLASGSDVTYPLAGLRSTLISFDQGDTHPILGLRWWSSSRLIETITLKATLKPWRTPRPTRHHRRRRREPSTKMAGTLVWPTSGGRRSVGAGTLSLLGCGGLLDSWPGW